MPNIVIALLAALGVGAWIYNKMYNRTGGLHKEALTVAAIGAFGALIVMFLVLRAVSTYLN